MQTVLVIAQFLACLTPCSPAGSILAATGGRGGRLLGRRHVHRCDQIIAGSILERGRTFVLIVTAATGAGSAEDQIVHHSWVAAGRGLEMIGRVLQFNSYGQLTPSAEAWCMD